MSVPAILFATLRFVLWEVALFAASARLARAIGWRSRPERWLGILALQVTLESSIAAALSFAHANSAAAYWVVAVVCGAYGLRGARRRFSWPAQWQIAILAALATPLVLLSFRPVEELDSINYLHYLLDWMANRATPYVFANNYVAFWELSFLPAWVVTRVDLFFPLAALKAVVLLALGAWLVGRELRLRGTLLLWTVFGSVTLRHCWYASSGVSTLKNDALHGAGFVLLTLTLLRASRRRLSHGDMALLAFGVSFAMVKYSGVFVTGFAIAAIFLAQRLHGSRPIRLRVWLACAGFVVLTSGHYYLRALVLHGNPFYPFQINIGPIHLPGSGDLSGTSILYSLRDSRLWRALFWPAGGVSPMGVLFPATLAAALAFASWQCLRAAARVRRVMPSPWDWAALAILAGWLLYFRSVYSASAWPGDLSFLINGLNSIRYVEGVLAVSELFLVALVARRFPWVAMGLVTVNLGSRLLLLYGEIPRDLFPWRVVAAAAAVGLAVFWIRRPAVRTLLATAILVTGGPFLVERNRAQWATHWNELKPAVAAVREAGLALLAAPETGFFEGHVLAAGNPVHPEVRCIEPEEMDGLAEGARPRYLAVLVMPGAGDWYARIGAELARWRYTAVVRTAYGAVLSR